MDHPNTAGMPNAALSSLSPTQAAYTPDSKRSAKRQKVTRACDGCKSRKRRCNGEVPCSVCLSNGAECKYDAVYTRGKLVQPVAATDAPAIVAKPRPKSQLEVPANSRSHGVSEEPESDGPGEYTGSGSAYAFLKRAWERFGHGEGAESLGSSARDTESGQGTSVFLFGDCRLPPLGSEDVQLPDRQGSEALLMTYFDFAMPTHRFLHRPTVSSWLDHMQDKHHGGLAPNTVASVQQAIVWMVLATAALFNTGPEPDSRKGGHASEQDAERYFYAARQVLLGETGKARLESVQARLAICLYLLHTGRPSEAWYTFGTTVQLSLVLGLHRARDVATPDIVHECGKRTFWALATLDTYLSVMLGRPALIHDRDVNQRFPRTVDDDELIVESTADTIGDKIIHASILHAKLAQIAKRTAQGQSSTQQQSDEDKLEAVASIMNELAVWRQSLPVVISGAVHPSSLIPIFRRQMMVLRLAHSHAVMLVTRPLLLAESARVPSLQGHIDACLNAANTTLDMLTGSTAEGTSFAAFWFTQYVAFNAVSITYVWLIQRKRNRFAALRAAFSDEELLRKTEAVHKHFSEAVEQNAPSLRYNVVLEELRQELLRLSGKGEIRIRPGGERQGAGLEVAQLLPEQPPGNPVPHSVDPEDLFLAEPPAMAFDSFDFPLEPDLWLQLDSFPFCEFHVSRCKQTLS